MLWVEISILARKPHVFLAKEVKIKQNQMNLKDAFWNWAVTHAQTIQNEDMYLACLEMWVARINFDLTFYVVWLRLPMPRYNNRRLKNCIKLDENRDENKTCIDSLIHLKSGRDSHWCFRIRQLFCHTSGSEHRHLKPDYVCKLTKWL